MSNTSKGLQDGYVYILNLGIDGLYKIGCTRKLRQRVKALSAANPRLKVEMAYKVLRMKKVEKFLHGQFWGTRYDREIFRLENENLTWIKDYLNHETGNFTQTKTGNCPACGSAMVLRKNRKRGNEFYGCSSYPSCTATVSVSRKQNIEYLL
jgi:formate dehydrogenase maturation protein FdhE